MQKRMSFLSQIIIDVLKVHCFVECNTKGLVSDAYSKVGFLKPNLEDDESADEEDQHGPGTNCWAQDYALIFNCWYHLRFNNNTTKYNYINIFKTRK